MPIKQMRKVNAAAVATVYALSGEGAMLFAVTQLGHPVRCPDCRGQKWVSIAPGPDAYGDAPMRRRCFLCNAHGLIYPIGGPNVLPVEVALQRERASRHATRRHYKTQWCR